MYGYLVKFLSNYKSWKSTLIIAILGFFMFPVLGFVVGIIHDEWNVWHFLKYWFRLPIHYWYGLFFLSFNMFIPFGLLLICKQLAFKFYNEATGRFFGFTLATILSIYIVFYINIESCLYTWKNFFYFSPTWKINFAVFAYGCACVEYVTPAFVLLVILGFIIKKLPKMRKLKSKQQ